jgi:hypothetical protein
MEMTERNVTIKRRSIEAAEAEVEAAAIKRSPEKDLNLALGIVKERIERDQSPAQKNISIKTRIALEEEAAVIRKKIEMETEIRREKERRRRIMTIILI